MRINDKFERLFGATDWIMNVMSLPERVSKDNWDTVVTSVLQAKANEATNWFSEARHPLTSEAWKGRFLVPPSSCILARLKPAS